MPPPAPRLPSPPLHHQGEGRQAGQGHQAPAAPHASRDTDQPGHHHTPPTTGNRAMSLYRHISKQRLCNTRFYLCDSQR